MEQASPRDRWPSVLDRNGNPVGAELDWAPPPAPEPQRIEGNFCRLEPLDVERHGADLHREFATDPSGGLWTWMGWGPFADEAEYLDWIRSVQGESDPLYMAVVDPATGVACGIIAYLRITPADGCLEIGCITFAPRLQRTTGATEGIAMLLDWAFEAGYRRVEWKCDSLNAASRRAARRLGFRWEGEFLQARVVKGRNRDTTWFSIIDTEWPAVRAGLDRWLDPGNFDVEGIQHQALDVRCED